MRNKWSERGLRGESGSDSVIGKEDMTEWWKSSNGWLEE